MRQNYIDAIKSIDPNQAILLENASSDKIKAFCDKHNAKV
jgi:hypothetical protein